MATVILSPAWCRVDEVTPVPLELPVQGGTVRHIMGYLHQDCLTHHGVSPSGLFGDDRGWPRDTDLIQRVISSASMAVTWQPVSDLRPPHSLKVGKQRGCIGRMLEREHSFVSAGLSWAAP